MDFGMPTLLELGDLRSNMEVCSRLGFHFVELNMNFPQFQLDALSDTAELTRLADTFGCYYTIHLDELFDPFCFNPAVADAWLQTAAGAVRTASAIGAPVINMHLCRGIYITLPDRKVFLYERYLDEYLARVALFRDRVAELLRGSGVTVCIENTDGFTTFHRQAIDILLQSGCFALTWDVGHSFCSGENDVPFILANGKYLRHMHLHDASGSHCHLPLGSGGLDLADRLRTASSNGCRCVVEVKTAQSLSDSADYLRKCGYIR